MYTQRRRIRNPAAYAAAVRRNGRSSYRSGRPYRRSFGRGAPRAKFSNDLRSAISSIWGIAKAPLGMIANAAGSRAAAYLGGGRARMARTYRRRGGRKAGRHATTAVRSKTSSGGSGVRISHREYIQDIYSSTEFQNIAFSINPGLISTFPWLSGSAQNFEQYQVNSMTFEYKTTSVDALNSTNTALGSVGLTTEYNALEEPFYNVQQFENNVGTVVTKPSLSASHTVDVRSSQTPVETLNVRLGEPETGDLRLYDLGTFQIAVHGMQKSADDEPFVIGQLFVTYDISFLKPKLSSGLNLGGQTAQFLINPQSRGNNISDDSPLGALDRAGDPTSRLALFNQAGIEFGYTNPTEPPDMIMWPLGANGLYRYTYRVHVYNTEGLEFIGHLSAPIFKYTNCTPQTIFQDYSYANINNFVARINQTDYPQDCDWIYSEVIYIPDPTLRASITMPRGTSGFRFGPVDPVEGRNVIKGDLIIGQVNGNLPLTPPSLKVSRFSKNKKISMDDFESMFSRMMLKHEAIAAARKPAKKTPAIEEVKDDDDGYEDVDAQIEKLVAQKRRKSVAPKQ